jgi:hypothetical protein
MVRTRRLFALLVAFGALGASAPAIAQTEVTDRDYTLDLYQGAAIGSLRIIGMGGVSVGIAEGSADTIGNPAAAAVRPATSRRRWDWDWHLDWLNAGLATDLDNSGITDGDGLSARMLTMGLVGRYGPWAVGVSGTDASRRLPLDDDTAIVPRTLVGRVVLARSFARGAYTVGLGSRVGTFSLGQQVDGRETTLFSLTGSALEAGLLWSPRERDLRIGATVGFPVTSDELQAQQCDPLDCEGYILPEKAAVPARVAVGAAWRVGPTPWNRTVAGDFRDERALTLAADLVIDGPVENGHGVGAAFVHRQLQPSGRSTSVSLRGGAEYEWVPGRVRVRAGSYWEPGRFEGVGGRLHGTAGVDWRFGGFCFWSSRYRTRLSLSGDVARAYVNTGVSVGFWH